MDDTQDHATLQLMEHRWKVVNEHGYSIREYARALGKSPETVHRYVRGWELWQERQARGDTSCSPADILVLASMSETRRQATEIVAEQYGIRPSQMN